ncbi:MAG: GAF domain-containing protein [Armatimonadetes bacterium]|nr:GAF domain-containing protein [Armatimonadota bacterium]
MNNPSASDLLLVLHEADLEMGRITPGDSYALFDYLRATCKRIAPLTDAFYVALYDPQNEMLRFPYHFDSESYDSPLTVRLGQGPTSWVVRHNEPLVFNDDDPIQHKGFLFGNLQRQSLSAVHLPIRAMYSAGEVRLIGVLSAQSYRRQAFNEDAVMAMSLLARRTGAILMRSQLEMDARAREEAADRATEQQREEHTQQMRAVVRLFVDTLQGLTMQAEKIRNQAAAYGRDIEASAARMCTLCYRSQTETANLPLPAAPPPSAHNRSVSDLSNPIFASLSDKQREILPRLAAGETNAMIAEHLCVSVDTVKFHCKGLFKKLGVANRVQAAQIYHDRQKRYTDLPPHGPGVTDKKE